jgi:hypothetical protein
MFDQLAGCQTNHQILEVFSVLNRDQKLEWYLFYLLVWNFCQLFIQLLTIAGPTILDREDVYLAQAVFEHMQLDDNEVFGY